MNDEKAQKLKRMIVATERLVQSTEGEARLVFRMTAALLKTADVVSDGVWFRPKHPAPPAIAEFLLFLLGSKRTVDAIVGDFEQLFRADLAEFGVVRARRRYWWRVLRNIGPAVWAKVKKISLIGIIIDYGRSKLGL